MIDIHLKNAIREMERSSCGVRDEANMERRTAGVTGMRLDVSDGGCGIEVALIGGLVTVRVDEVDAVEFEGIYLTVSAPLTSAINYLHRDYTAFIATFFSLHKSIQGMGLGTLGGMLIIT